MNCVFKLLLIIDELVAAASGMGTVWRGLIALDDLLGLAFCLMQIKTRIFYAFGFCAN